MGLRGATIFLPLLGAIFLRNRIHPLAGVVALWAGPSSAILWAIFGPRSINPLYIGLTVSAGTLLLGCLQPPYGLARISESSNIKNP